MISLLLLPSKSTEFPNIIVLSEPALAVGLELITVIFTTSDSEFTPSLSVTIRLKVNSLPAAFPLNTVNVGYLRKA